MKYGRMLALGAAVSVCTGGIVVPAWSAEPLVVKASDIPTRLVRYADINLAAADGRRLLNRRVSVAVNQVCEGSESYATFQSDGMCKSAAWGRARPQIDAAVDRARQFAASGLVDESARAIVITL